MERMIVVSADGHVGGPWPVYREYLESKYHDDLDSLEDENTEFLAAGISQRRYSDETLDLIDPNRAIRGDGELGAFEVERRLRELDREGIAAEILIAGTQLSTLPFFAPVNRPRSAELRAAGARAYHRHLADYMAASDGRLFAIADPGTCLDMDETVRELQWAAEHRFVGVHPPGQIDDPALPPISDAYYEPFWNACVDSGLVINAHAGYGSVQGMFAVYAMREMMGNPDDETLLEMVMAGDLGLDKMPVDSPFRVLLYKPRRLVWQLMISGVLDRHPELRVVLTEVRSDWVPATLEYLDAAFDAGKLASARRPSEYWETNFAATPSSPRPYEISQRDQIGVDRLLFGADYPHPEGTWPNTWDWIRSAFAGVAEGDARKILGDNAIRLYSLDGEHLAKIAEKIGPTPDDVLGDGHDVDERLITNFHSRSGYNRPAELLDPEFMDSLLEADVALTA